ncbi:hypothetical protein LA304_03635 [Celeribacter sp. ASW11-22]|nr:hypothetical protein [Celeribacter litoreus]
MKRFTFPAIMSAALAAAFPMMSLAQGFGEDFMMNWDLNEDGQVTQDEVQERRGDLFYMFDADEDGRLNDEEYATFDETRALDRQMHLEEYGMTAGPGAGNGPQGQPKLGKGPQAQQARNGFAAGIDQVQGSMTRLANDLDGNGVVTREEFVGNGAQWFSRMDRDQNGLITLDDFGQ